MTLPDDNTTATLKLSDNPSADEYAAAFANMRKAGTYEPSKAGDGGRGDGGKKRGGKKDPVENYGDVKRAISELNFQKAALDADGYPGSKFDDKGRREARANYRRAVNRLRSAIAGREEDGATGGAELLSSLSIKEFDDESTLTVTKQADGAHRWIAISSSAYRDRDGEIVSTKALEADVARADADGDYGPLRWWHVKGLDIGTCDYNAMHGRFLVESGTFKNAAIAEAIKAHASELAVSIGFNHPHNEPDGEKVFHTIRRFERSFLPRNRESNLFTTLGAVMKESDMTKDKKEQLAELVGAEVVSDLIAQADTTQKAADEAAVAFKGKKEDAMHEAGETTDEETAEGSDDSEEDMPPKKMKKAVRTKATVGNMSVDEFASALGSALQAALAPVVASTKEVNPAIANVVKLIEAQNERIKELESDVPAVVRTKGVESSGIEELLAAALKAVGFGAETVKSEQDALLDSQLRALKPN